MKNRQQELIQPGLCEVDPDTGRPMCPPADRIECIVVDKVYDSCFQVDEKSRFLDDVNLGPNLNDGDVVECELTQGATVSCMEIDRTSVGDGFFNITLRITVPVTLTNPAAPMNNPNRTSDETFTFIKTVTLCSPEEATIDCSESTLLSCNCVVVGSTGANSDIECEIQVCLVIKSILRVQLLVPSYGFCVPAPCTQIAGTCPPLPPSQCF